MQILHIRIQVITPGLFSGNHQQQTKGELHFLGL